MEQFKQYADVENFENSCDIIESGSFFAKEYAIIQAI